MELKITIETTNNYDVKDVITSFHYALQLGESHMKSQGLNVYSEIVKEIRENDPSILPNKN